MMKKIKQILKLKLYNFIAKKLFKFVAYLLTYENNEGLFLVQAIVKNTYENINDHNHVKKMYEKVNAEKSDVKHIDFMFDKYFVNTMFYLRKITGKHKRIYQLLICVHKRAKTVFKLSVSNETFSRFIEPLEENKDQL